MSCSGERLLRLNYCVQNSEWFSRFTAFKRKICLQIRRNVFVWIIVLSQIFLVNLLKSLRHIIGFLVNTNLNVSLLFYCFWRLSHTEHLQWNESANLFYEQVLVNHPTNWFSKMNHNYPFNVIKQTDYPKWNCRCPVSIIVIEWNVNVFMKMF